jgi:putative transposase
MWTHVIRREKVEAIVNATLHTTPRDAMHWSVRSMAQTQRASPATVHRIWQAANLQPHRTKTFKLSRDPHFVQILRLCVEQGWQSAGPSRVL